MRRRISLSVAIACTVTIPAVAQSHPHSLDQLHWLAGCWEQRSTARTIHEQWMAPLGDLMLGMARTVANGRLLEFEQVRIELREGVATYVANPSGQAQAAFRAVEFSDSAVRFSNHEHDFPNDVGYRRLGTDSLLAYISGVQNGKPVTISFPMKRSDCG